MNFDKHYYFGRRSSNYSDYKIHRRRILWWPILRMLKKHQGGSFLDVGCAFGYLVHYAKPYFKRVAGVDISDFAIEEAKKEFPDLEFYRADTAHLPFRDGEFDVVTAVDVLEHTPDVSASLKEINRVLKSGGVVFLRMPYAGFWRKFLGRYDKDLSHISVLTAAEYGRIVWENNFKIVKSRTYITPWGGNINFLLKKQG